jgi:hypothetical protein
VAAEIKVIIYRMKDKAALSGGCRFVGLTGLVI